MKIIIRNQANVPNKFIRFIKWKLFKLKRKFKQLIYAEVFVKAEGNTPTEYAVNIKLGIPGYDLFVKNKSENIGELMNMLYKSAHLRLAQSKLRN
jgi:ribosome-associated translation inhibitor RaiA